MRILDPIRHPWLLALAVTAAAGFFLAADCNNDEGTGLPGNFQAVTPQGNVGNPGDTVAFGFDLNSQIRNNRYDALHWDFGAGAVPRSLVTHSRSVIVTLRDEGSYTGAVTTLFDNTANQRYLFEFTIVD